MSSLGRSLTSICVLLIGLIVVYHVTQLPQFSAYRAVDVLQLIGAGMCIGVALPPLIAHLRVKPAA